MKAKRTITGRPIWWCGLGLCLATLVFACNRPPAEVPKRPTAFSGPTMGTHYTVKVTDLPPSVDVQVLEADVLRKLSRIEALMSTYQPDSELSRLNRFDGDQWFTVSRETASVIVEAIRIGHLTGGAFDITVGPLVNLWGFGPDGNAAGGVPSPEELRRTRSQVGVGNIQVRLSPPAVRKKRKDVRIDLSAIAKGFAVDQIAEHLEHCGVENYLVEVGGELAAKGHNHRGGPWQVAIESPIAGVRTVQRIVALEDTAMATSGDYRNYFEEDGIRYSHIIDPRSAEPVADKLVSVTVLTPSCMRADALATGLIVLGPAAGYDLALQEGLPVLFIVKGKSGFVERPTPSFTEVFQ